MSRTLTPAVDAALSAEHVPLLCFIELQFASGTVRVCNAGYDFQWNGFTWLGAGNVASIQPIQEGAELQMYGVAMQLSGVNPALVSSALGEQYQGRPAKIWVAPLEVTQYLSLPGVAGNYASTPDAPANRIAGDIDIRAKVALTVWIPASFSAILSKRNGSTPATACYVFGVNGTDGKLLFFWSDGTNQFIVYSTVAPTVSNGATLWVRATLSVNNGAGGNDVKFYTATDGVTWTQLGATVTSAGVTSIRAGSDYMEIGSQIANTASFLQGKVYYAEIRNGIAGQIVAKFDPTKDAANGATSFTSSTGEVWTINQSGSPAAQLVTTGYNVLVDPVGPFQFRMDTMAVEMGDTATITLTAESRLADWDRPRTRRYTSEDQAQLYPADKFFEFVPELQSMEIIFGLVMTVACVVSFLNDIVPSSGLI